MSIGAIAAGRQVEAGILARLERLPISRLLVRARLIVGAATFFDGYNTLAIAYALPVLVRMWHLAPTQIGYIISAGYLGQLVGAFFFSWLAERVGRLPVLMYTITLYAVFGILCIFSWGAASLMAFRFIQGIGTGGEVPVAGAYINEFVGAKVRGRFFLLYQVIFPVGLAAAGVAGYFLVPLLGWKVLFLIDSVPALLLIPLRWSLPESPRWLLARGRAKEAEAFVERAEAEAVHAGVALAEPKLIALKARAAGPKARFRDLFKGIYLRRTLVLAVLATCVYLVNNGLITWLPTLYRNYFHVSLKTSLGYGFITSGIGVLASIACALLIDRVGRKPWYVCASLLPVIPLVVLAVMGTASAVQVLVLASCVYAIIQTISFSLFLYSAELYPTRMRALGVGMGSAWVRIGSTVGPMIVGAIVAGYSVRWVFIIFAIVCAAGGTVCAMFALETKGRVLEELSPE
jgi:putative MFS transporter